MFLWHLISEMIHPEVESDEILIVTEGLGELRSTVLTQIVAPRNIWERHSHCFALSKDFYVLFSHRKSSSVRSGSFDATLFMSLAKTPGYLMPGVSLLKVELPAAATNAMATTVGLPRC